MVRQEIGIRKKKDKNTEDADMGFGDWGGYMAAKRAKLIDQFHDAKIEKISNIFKGIAIHVNGLTKPPIDVLKNLMAAHGGLFHAYQVSSTTHIIASNLASVKIRKLGPVPIVKPLWITESIEFGKLLDYRRYLLYTNQSLSQPRIQFAVIDKPSTATSSTKVSSLEQENHCDDLHDSTIKSETDKSVPNNGYLSDSGNELEKPFWNSNSHQSQAPSADNGALNRECNQGNIYVSEKLLDTTDVKITDQSELSIPLKVETEEYKLPENEFTNRSRASTKTAADPSFLEEFYSNSRLHLISTLGAEYKQLVNQMREKSNGIFPGREKLLAKGELPKQNLPKTVIMHIDMDCFFVSVGLRKHPELKGKPVAIAHARSGEINNIKPEQKKNREQEFALYSERLPIGVTSRVDKIDTLSSMSEIASCSYEARRYGLKNGMFLGQAVKMCPDLQTLPYDFEGYKEVSHTLYNIIASYTLDIEAVSCDEMYVDVTKILEETGLNVEEWADHIRNEISLATGCPCSTGFGSNRLQARLATRKAKPAGKFHLKCEDVEAYLAEVPLADLPGVGRATLAKLSNLRLHTCGDIQTVSLKTLQSEIGHKAGETLKEQAVGIDRKPLNYCHERKSVSAEVNYGIRFKSLEECQSFLQSLSDEVYKRLSDINMKARCVTLKLLVRSADAPLETAKFLGHGICDSFSKSSTNIVINDSQAIYKEVLTLYNPSFSDLRGIGIQLSKLEKIAPIHSAISNFLKQPSTKKSIKESKSIEKNQIQSNFNLDPGEGTSTAKGKAEQLSSNNNNETTSMSIQAPILKIHIDPDVLKELPEELRREVIAEYQIKDLEQFGEVNPGAQVIKTDDKQEVSGGLHPASGTECAISPFSDLSWEQMKPLIKKWVTSAEKPEELDTLMIGEHFKTYAINRKIELLFTIFKSLHRIFSNLSCEWHKAYFIIVKITQEGMMAKYGNTLKVERAFTCCHI